MVKLPQKIEKKIAIRAYEIWEKLGKPQGHELDHWLKAEQEIICNICKKLIVCGCVKTSFYFGFTSNINPPGIYNLCIECLLRLNM